MDKNDYEKAKNKLTNSSDDKIGLFGQASTIATGAIAGGLASGAVASVVGATTIFGSSALASITGGFLVVTTPIGWVLGTAAIGSAAAYGISKLVKSGAKYDERKAEAIKEIEEKIEAFDQENNNGNIDFTKLEEVYLEIMNKNLISKEEVNLILQGVKDKQFTTSYAINLAKDLMDEIKEIPSGEKEYTENIDHKFRSVFVIFYKHLVYLDDNVSKKEISSYNSLMQKRFNCSEKLSEKLFLEAPIITDIESFFNELREEISDESFLILIDDLNYLAKSDGLDDSETNFLEQLSSLNKSKFIQYHIAQDGKQFGLHSIDEILNKLKCKDLRLDNLLVWKEGMENWEEAKIIPQINKIIMESKRSTPPLLPSTPPPLG